MRISYYKIYDAGYPAALTGFNFGLLTVEEPHGSDGGRMLPWRAERQTFLNGIPGSVPPPSLSLPRWLGSFIRHL